jgi:predicted RND superfamily exporter protein
MAKKNFDFSAFIIKYRWIFIGIFAAMIVLSCFLLPNTKIIYDLSGYLPEKSDTTAAMNVLKAEFDDKGMLYLMVAGVTEEEAATLGTEIAALDGVDTAVFDAQKDYKDGAVLYTVTLNDYDSTPSAFEAVDTIKHYLANREAYITGQSAYSYYTKEETEESILSAGIVIAIIIVVLLLFTSETYFELVLMMLILGASVLINMGTNYLFHGISYLSNLIALILQLALSIDYSVILLHRFSEEAEQTTDMKSAASAALRKGMPEILSSSLTTIAGLCALILMTMRIGAEIGISLAKSIVISLITVLFLMPPLLVIFSAALKKTKHRSFVPKVFRPAKKILKARKVIVPVFLVVIALAAVGQFNNSYIYNLNNGSKIVADKIEIAKHFGYLNPVVVIVPKGEYETEKAMADYIRSHEIVNASTGLSVTEIAEGITLNDIVTKEEFSDIIQNMASGTDYEDLIPLFAASIYNSYLTENGLAEQADAGVRLVDLLIYIYHNDVYKEMLGEYAPMLGQLANARAMLESAHYSRITFNLNADFESKEAISFVKELKANLGNYYTEYYIAGESLVTLESAVYFPKDNLLVSLLTAIFILLIIIFTFRNLFLPFLLTLAIQGGVWINFAIPFLAGNNVSFIGYLIIVAIQMGATIDYGIVLTNRYRSLRSSFPDRLDAMAEAESSVFATIITSGLILTLTGLALSIITSGVVSQMGTLLCTGAFSSMLIVLLVLPSMLLVFEKISDAADFSKISASFSKAAISKSRKH